MAPAQLRLRKEPKFYIAALCAGDPVIAPKDLAGKRLAEAEVFEWRGVGEEAVAG